MRFFSYIEPEPNSGVTNVSAGVAAPKTPEVPFVGRFPQVRLPREKERELTLQWQKSAKPDATWELLRKSHHSLFTKKLAEFRTGPMPQGELMGKALQLYRKSLLSWDPTRKGAADLHTHIINGWRPLRRFSLQHQNTARINEDVAKNIKAVDAANSELSEKLGYEPTHQQIADYTLKWEGPVLSLKEVKKVYQKRRAAYDIDVGGDLVEGAGFHTDDPYEQVIPIIKPLLKPHEQKVHEIMFPTITGVAPIQKSGDIAKKLGWHVSKVSKAKRAIMTQIDAMVED